MKLIAESGSTRTEWALVEDNHLIQRVFTEGLNPFFQTRREISRSVRLGLPEIFSKGNQNKYIIMEPDVPLMRKRIYWVHHQQHNSKPLSKWKATFLPLPAVCSNARPALLVSWELALIHAFMMENCSQECQSGRLYLR